MSDSIVREQRRRGDGKRVDVWEAMLPNGQRADIPLYMRRDVDTKYRFYVELNKDEHMIAGHLEADTPAELRQLLDTAMENHVHTTWDKQLLIEFEDYENDQRAPDDPGTHTLEVQWRVIYCKRVGKHMLYVHADDIYPRYQTSYGGKPKHFMPWSQHREDVLRELGRMIHMANERLNGLLDSDRLADQLDYTTVAGNLLTQ